MDKLFPVEPGPRIKEEVLNILALVMEFFACLQKEAKIYYFDPEHHGYSNNRSIYTI